MNDKCACGTGATIDKCFLKVNAPPELVTSLHFDDSKLHHVAAKCGVFAETDIVNLIKSGIPSNEVLCSLADAIVLQNLCVLTRGGTLKHKVLLLGGPEHVPAVPPGVLAPAHPADVGRARLRLPEGRARSRSSIFVPKNAQYYAALGAVLYGLHEAEDVGVLSERSTRCASTSPPAARRASARPRVRRSRRRATSSTTSASCTRSRSSSRRRSSRGAGRARRHRPRRRVDLEQGGPRRLRDGQDPREGLPALEGQPDPGHEGAPRAAPRRTSRSTRRRKLEVMGFGATGYAADVLEECVTSDVNIVETVAHMMSAVHFFGDVDVICDIGGQDIKVLFMKNGDIANFRLSNSCSAGNGMLLQATADSFGVPVTRVRRRRVQGRARAEVLLRVRRLPRHRPRELPEGGLLEGGDARGPRAGAAEERVAVRRADPAPRVARDASSCSRAARSTTSPRSRRRSTTSRSACRTARCSCTRTRARRARSARRWRRCASSSAAGVDLHRHRCGDRPRVHVEERRRDDLPLLPEQLQAHVHRHEAARRLDQPLHRRLLLREGHRREQGGDARRSSRSARRSPRQFPNLVDYEAQARVHALLRHGADARGRRADRRRRGASKGIFGMRRVAVKRPFQRSSQGGVGGAAPRAHRHPARAQPLLDRARSSARTSRRIGIPKQNVVFSDETTEEMWVEGGKYGSIDPCFPSKVAQAHIHNLLFDAAHREEAAQVHLLPDPHARANFVADTMDNASCPIVAGAPDVMKAAFTKEVDFFATRGIEYLDPALSFVEPTLMRAAHVRDVRAAPRHHRGRERLTPARRRWKALDALRRGLAGEGPRHPRDGRSRGPRRHPDDRPPVPLRPGPQPRHPRGVPGARVSDPQRALDPAGPRSTSSATTRKTRARAHARAPLELNHVWPENYSVNSAQKVWAAGFAAHHPNVVVLDLSSFKCGHDAPTYGLIDSIIETSKTPYAALHDIDANKPSGSIKIRVKTYAHALKLHEERLQDARKRKGELEHAHRQEAPRAPRRCAPSSWPRAASRTPRSSAARRAARAHRCLRGAHRPASPRLVAESPPRHHRKQAVDASSEKKTTGR